MANSAWHSVTRHYTKWNTIDFSIDVCFTRRRLLSLKLDKLINHFSRPPICDGVLGRPLSLGHLIWLRVWCACVYLCVCVWVDYPRWWAGVCSWPPPLRWCRQPPPRGIVLLPEVLPLPLNGWLRPQSYWREIESRWPNTRSDTDSPDRIHRRALRRIAKNIQRGIVYPTESLLLPCTPGWCRSVGQREEGPTIRWWRCCSGSLPSTLSLAGEGRWVLMGRGEWKVQRHKDKQQSKMIEHFLNWVWSVSYFRHSQAQFIFKQQAKNMEYL